MNSIKISVSVDRKAALLAGRVMAETCEIEVSPESIGENWPVLVEHLDMSSTVPVLQDWMKVSDATATEVKLLVDASADRRAKEVREITLRRSDYLDALAQLTVRVAQYPEQRVCHVSKWDNGEPSGWEFGDSGFAFNGVGRELNIEFPDSWEDAFRDLRSQRAAIEKNSRLDIDARNRAAMSEAAPRLIAQKAQADAESAAAVARAEAEKKAAAAVKYASRLEYGYWERETGSYNVRKYSAPWCATVSFEAGPKPVYSWGESTGKWGSAGLLRVECAPGDFIAWGQKDLRRPGNSDHNIMRMREDGSMESFDNATEAFKAWRESQKVVA